MISWEAMIACPGYASYELLQSGGVLVNGQLPKFTDERELESLQEAWEAHGTAIQGVAAKYDLPVPWLVGIMMAESRGNAHACSSCAACRSELCETGGGQQCCAFGLMQMIGPTARTYGVTPDAIMGNPAVALEAAAKLIVVLEDKYGADLVKIAAAYNGGIKNCNGQGTTFGYGTQGDYPMKVVTYANTFVGLGLKASPSKALGWALALAGAGIAGAIYTGRLRV